MEVPLDGIKPTKNLTSWGYDRTEDTSMEKDTMREEFAKEVNNSRRSWLSKSGGWL